MTNSQVFPKHEGRPFRKHSWVLIPGVLILMWAANVVAYDRVTSHPAVDYHPAPSADGRFLAFVSERSGNADIWLKSLSTGVVSLPRQLTIHPSSDRDPSLNAAGTELLYISHKTDPRGDVYWMDLASGHERRLTTLETGDSLPKWGKQGNVVYYLKQEVATGDAHLYRRSLMTDEETLVVTGVTAYSIGEDGWLAVTRNRELEILNEDRPQHTRTLLGGDALNLWPAVVGEDSVIVTRYISDTNEDGRIDTDDESSVWVGSWDFQSGQSRQLYQLTPRGNYHLYPAQAHEFVYFTDLRRGDIFRLHRASFFEEYQSYPRALQIAHQYLDRENSQDGLLVLENIGRNLTRPLSPSDRAAFDFFHSESLREAGLWQRAQEVLSPYLHQEGALGIQALIHHSFLRFHQQIPVFSQVETQREARKYVADIMGLASSHKDDEVVYGTALVESGRLFAEIDDSIAALEYLVKAAALSDREVRAKALFARGVVYRKLGNESELLQVFLDVLDLFGEEHSWGRRAIHQAIAVSEQGEGVHQKTAALYGLIERTPQFPALMGTTLLRIAELYDEAGEQRKALQALDRLLENPPPLSSLVTRAYRRKAEILSASERFEEAAAVYAVLVERTGQDQALLRRNEELLVLQLVRQAIKDRNAGEIRVAAKAFKRILEEHPSSVEAHRGYIETKVMVNELPEVQVLYQDLVSRFPDNPVYRYSHALALTYVQPLDLGRVLSMLQGAIRLNPGVPYFHQTLGWAFEQQERLEHVTGALEQAEQAYRIALELNDEFQFPQVESNLLLNLGNTYVALGNFSEAYRAYVKRESGFLPRGDSITELLYRKNYGEACFKSGRTAESLKQYALALSRVPADQAVLKAELLERMGLSHQDAGHYAEAVEAFSHALAMNVELGNQKNVALLQRNIGVNLYNLSALEDQGNRDALKKALHSYFVSLELIEKVGVKAQQDGVGLLNVNVALNEKGSEAATGFDQAGEQKLMFSYIAGTYEKLGEPAPARDYFLKKLHLITARSGSEDNAGLLAEKAVVLNRLGMLSHRIGQYDEALDYFRQSLGYTRTLNLAYGTSVNLFNLSRLAVEKVLDGQEVDFFILENLVMDVDRLLDEQRMDRPTWFALTNTAFLLAHLQGPSGLVSRSLEDSVRHSHRLYELKRRIWSYYRQAEAMLDHKVIPEDQVFSTRMMLKLNMLELARAGEDAKAYARIQADLRSLVEGQDVADGWLEYLAQAENASNPEVRQSWIRQAVNEVFLVPIPVRFNSQNITAKVAGLQKLSRMAVDLWVEQGKFAEALELGERLEMAVLSLLIREKLGEMFLLQGIGEYGGLLQGLFGDLRKTMSEGDKENQEALLAELDEIFQGLQDEYPWSTSLLWPYRLPEETLPEILNEHHAYLKVVEGGDGRFHGFVHNGRMIRHFPIQRQDNRLRVPQSVFDLMQGDTPLYVSVPSQLNDAIRSLLSKDKPVTQVSSFYDFVNGFHLRSLFYSNVVLTGEGSLIEPLMAGEVPISLTRYQGEASEDWSNMPSLDVLLADVLPEDSGFPVKGSLEVREWLPFGALQGAHHSAIMLQSIEPGTLEGKVLVSALIRAGFPHVLMVQAGPKAEGYRLVSQYLAYLGDLPADVAINLAVADSSGGTGKTMAGQLFGYAGMKEEEKTAFASSTYSQRLLQAVSAYQEGKNEVALSNIEQSLSLIHYAGKTEDLIDLTKLAVDASFRLGRYEKAVFHQEKLLTLVDGETHPEEKTEALYRLGILYSRLERFDLAIQRLEEATRWWGKVEELDRLAESVATLGIVRENMGSYSQALDEFGKSFELYTELGEVGDMAAQHRRIGRIYYLRLGRYEKARERFGAALDLYGELRDSSGQASTLFELGLTYEKMGLFSDARHQYEEGLKLGETLNDEFLLATGNLYLANVDWFQGNYQEAFQHLGQAQTLAESANDAQLTIMVKNTRGLMYWTLNELDTALLHLEQAVDLAENAEIPTELASSLNNLGLVYRQRGDMVTALEQFKKAKAIDERLGSRWGLGYDDRNIGMALLKLGRLEEAESHFLQAEASSAGIKNAINWVKALLELGNVNRELNRPEKALDYYERTYALAKQYGLKEVWWRAAVGRARIFKAQGLPDQAFSWYADAVRVVEGMRAALKIDELRNSFQTNKQDLYRETITLLISLGRTDEAFNYLERSRSRSFIDLLGNQKMTLKNEVDQSALDRIESLAVSLESINRELGSYDVPPAEAKGRQRAAQVAYEEALLDLKQRNPGLSSFVAVDPLTLQQVQARLEPGVALASYMLGDHHSFVWLVQSQGTQFFKLPVGSEKVTRMVQQYRSLVQHSEPVDTELRELYRWLIAPMEQPLQEVEYVGIIPDGSLHFLSFAALKSDQGYLIDQWPLFYTPSASVLEFTFAKRKTEKQTKVLALGNPDLGNYNYDLPLAELEAKSIRWNYPDMDILTGANATKEWLIKNVSQYGIIHLASHGEFDEVNPLFSSLWLASEQPENRRLTVQEIFGLNLQADLVTLSACQTGLGKLEAGELIGLNRAFIYAGTHALVSALWRVDDLSTSVLMKHFYRNYVTMDKAKSLRQAQLLVKKEFPHPSYWAAFNLVGDYQ